MENAIPIKYLNTTKHIRVCFAEISNGLILGTSRIARNKVLPYGERNIFHSDSGFISYARELKNELNELNIEHFAMYITSV
jgi:hypothetical protein